MKKYTAIFDKEDDINEWLVGGVADYGSMGTSIPAQSKIVEKKEEKKIEWEDFEACAETFSEGFKGWIE